MWIDMEQYRRALQHFGWDYDPLGPQLRPDDIFATRDVKRAARAVINAAQEYVISIVVGDVGAGKSSVVGYALKQLPESVIIVEPAPLESEQITIRDIEREIIYALVGRVGTYPAKNLLARNRIVARALGQVKRKVLLVIDEAQGLRMQTLRALKRLWNLSYMGRSPLMGIALFGQYSLETKLAELYELEGRAEIIRLSGLAEDEIEPYLESKVSGLFDGATAQELYRNARVPLQVNNLARQTIVTAYLRGKTVIDAEDVQIAVGQNPRLLLVRRYGLTITEVAREAGITKQQAHKALHNVYGGRSEALKKTMAAVDRLVKAKDGK